MFLIIKRLSIERQEIKVLKRDVPKFQVCGKFRHYVEDSICLSFETVPYSEHYFWIGREFLRTSMKLVLDEEEVWVLECIKEAHIDRGFHIRDVIKKAKAGYGLSRSTVYEIVGYLEFHGLIKTNKSGYRELDPGVHYFVICPGCGKEVPGNEYIKENGRAVCEDCYLEGHQKIKFADPVAVRSKKLFRKQHGLEGTDGLTELQKEIYSFILQEGGATPEKISNLFKLSLQETRNQLAILRHCELLKWRIVGEEMYMVPFDS